PLSRDDYNRPLNSYRSILRANRNFRLLYIGQTISQLGDWFNAVAVFALLLDLTGSATAVAWMMIVQFLPVALIGPLAGVVVDRGHRDGGGRAQRRVRSQCGVVFRFGVFHRADALRLDAGGRAAADRAAGADRHH